MDTIGSPSDYFKLANRTFWGERFDIPCQGTKMAACLHLPPEELIRKGGTLPVVIILHGLGSNRQEFAGIFVKTAATLAMRGFAVVRYDARGCGETGGSTMEINLTQQVADVGAVMDLIKNGGLAAAGLEVPPLDEQRIALLGLSMGGLTAAAALGSRQDIAACVLWEPPYELLRTSARIFGPINVKAIRMAGFFQAGLITLSPEFFECLQVFDSGKAVADFRGPVLLVWGTKDQIVPVETAEDWQRAFKDTDLKTIYIEEADHAFTQDRWAWRAIEESADWLAEKLSS